MLTGVHGFAERDTRFMPSSGTEGRRRASTQDQTLCVRSPPPHARPAALRATRTTCGGMARERGGERSAAAVGETSPAIFRARPFGRTIAAAGADEGREDAWCSQGGSPEPAGRPDQMPSRTPLDTLRPGSVPDLCYGFGRDYAVPMLTRRSFARCGEAVLSARDTLPHRLSLIGLSASRRPPC
jgi:hypothetical protein